MSVAEYGLTIYSWVAIGVLVAFLWRVAYFYERTSGQKVSHYVLALPSLLLMAGAAWYIWRDIEFVGQPTGDILLCGGGVALFLFGNRLRELMTGERK